MADLLPTAQGPSNVTVTEGVAYSFTGSNRISLNDSDGGGPATVEVTLSVAHGTLTLGSLTGLTFTTGDGSGDASMVFTASQTDADSALATLSYTATGNTDTSDSLNIQINGVAVARDINLRSLASSDGFRIAGVGIHDNFGNAVSSAGDINGDGIDDLIVGAVYADPNSLSDAGAAYVVYGRSGGYSSVDLAALASSDGFRIAGASGGDKTGWSVSSAGDVNGDGVDDMIVGARYADPNSRSDAGTAYVIYGRSGGYSGVGLATLASSDGFKIAGVSAYDQAGYSVSSAGDVNGDGIDDLIVGAYYADPNSRSDAGAAYVVYGRSGGYSGIDLAALASSDGFRIAGADENDNTGWSASSAGDVNGDGIEDLIVGAISADPSGRNYVGAAYVIYGRSSGYSGIDLATLASSDGFTIVGVSGGDFTGWSVSSAGDVNHDGIDDLMVGANRADPNDRDGAGAAYVIYGRSGGYSSVDLADLASSDGFRIAGANGSDRAGYSVSSAGDVNGDGIDDLIVGAAYADANGETNAGAAYVIYGKSGGYSDIDLADLASSDGFRIAGATEYDTAGVSVSAAGDINRDGVDDLIVGASRADPSDRENAGASYVIYGVGAATPTTNSITININGVNDAPGFTGLDGNAAFTEGGSAVVLDANVTVADAELDLAGNYNGAVLTISRSGGTAVADDRFSFASSSDFTVSGSSLMAGGQTIASFTSSGGTLTVTFTTHATPALVDKVMQHVAYSNASATPPGSVTLAWTLSDGNTGAQGSGGALSATGSSVVTITAVDGLPTAQGPSSVTATEGVAYSFTGSNLISLNDADGGGPATVKVTLSVAHGTLTLGTLTGLTFVTGDGTGDANMVFTASQTDANGALATLSYTATGSTDTSDSLNIRVGDVGNVGVSRAIDLASLASSDGFAIAGAASYDSAGYSVSSAGDINGDGIDDLIVGAIYADPSGREDVGAAYVVYGRSGGYSGVDLAALVSSDGFKIAGIGSPDHVGYSVSSAGDINSDGIDDMIVGAKFADPGGRNDAGAAYVVYGRSGGHSGIDLAAMASSDGFTIVGASGLDDAGWSVSSAGDVNGDGIDDLIVGAIYADPSNRDNAGAAYVVYGRSGGYSGIDLSTLASSDGFRIAGVTDSDNAGWSVSSAGDVNGDGIADLIIGAKYADPNERSDAGAAYVVYGRSGGYSGIDLATLASSDGFTIAGAIDGNYAGTSVSSVGDVNGDGIDDVIVGAANADPGDRAFGGAAYVVYGKSSGYSNIDLAALASSDGFRIAAASGGDQAGVSVSSAGDVNGDGIDDLIVGAHVADPSGRTNAGAAYVIYGKSGGYSNIDLAALASSDGFKIAGASNNDRAGTSVSAAGDINGDGVDDLIVGATGADPSGRTNAGASYVIYGVRAATPTDSSISITIADLAAPSNLALADASNSGSTSDAVTNDTTPTIQGMATAGATVKLYKGSTLLGTGTAGSDGAWSITPTSTLNDGNHDLTATATVGSHTTGSSTALSVTIDTTAPSAPVISAIAATNDTTPVISGTAEAGSTVNVSTGGATYRTIATGGNWSIDLGTATPSSGTLSINTNGSNAITATATDIAGNISAAGTQSVTIDATAPAAPVISSIATTNDTTPVISGTADAGSTVTVSIGGATYRTIATGGNWSLDLGTASPVSGTLAVNANGSNAITATAADALGNISSAGTQSVTIDTTAPSAPVISSIAATSDTTPVISGTAEAGSTVTVNIGGATYRTVASGGSWSLDLGTATPVSGTLAVNTNGSNAITATATDIAGNISAAGTQSVTIDATAPAAPVINAVATANDTTPVISGTAEAGSTVTVSIGGATYRTIATGGTWSVDLGAATPVSGTLAVNTNGSNAITATAADALGNISSPGTQSVTIDTTAPSAPVISSIAATSDTTPVISGTAEAGSTVTVNIGGATYRTVASGGSWSLDLGTATPVSGTLAVNTNGSNAITATATDIAGNISAAGTQSVTIDATAPAAPVINAVATANDTTPVISGTAEAGSTVTVSIGGATYRTIATGGTWSVDLGAATPVSGTLAVNTNGSNAITATATDMAGNLSAIGTQSVTIDVRPPLISDLNITQARVDGGLLFGFDISADEAGATYTWTFTGSGGGSLSGNGSMTGTSQSLSSLNLDSLTGSTLTLTVVLTDSYGNSGVARTVTLTRAGDAVIIPVPPKTAQIVDGADVTYTQNAGGTGGTTTIKAPPPDRVDDNSTGNAALADVPVVQEQHTNPATGQVEIINTLTVSLPANISAAISGTDRRTDVSQSLTDMIREINQRTDAGSGSQEGLSVGSTSYLSTLPTDSQLVVRSLDFTSQGQDDVVVQVTGADMGTALPVVLVLNTTGVSGHTIIDLNDVQFAAIIGDATIVGGAGQQTVYGDANSQVMILGEGDDELHGGDGDDTVASTLGQDTLFGDAGNDVVHGGDGNDWVLGGTGDDVVGGGTGDDRGFGGDGNDILFGEDGNDTLAGGSGADTLDGGAGDDILFGEEGNDLVMAGMGNDMVAAGDGADTVLGGAGDDLLGLGKGDDLGFGEDGNDILFGEDGNDTLSGGAGNDTLNGGAGDDTLFADGGFDMLWGGEGRDVFAFGAQSGGTVIADFTAGVDQLALYDKVLDLATLLATAKVVNGNTIFDLGGHGTITIIGQTDVSAAWFTGAM